MIESSRPALTDAREWTKGGTQAVRIAALTLGLLGGIIALSASGTGLALGGVGAAVGIDGGAIVVGGGWAALAFSVLGLVGAALAIAKPRLAGSLMIVVGIGGFVANLITYVVSGPLLLVAGLLALLAKQPRAVRFAGAAAAALALITTGTF
jgi:hypothetical protein